MQRLARAGVDQEHPGVVEDRAPVGAGDAREQPAQVGDPRRQVARDREVVEDRVVLGPRRDPARVRVGERPVEELTEVATGQVAVAVVEPLADDRALLREQELRRAADDPRRLVDDVRVAEREVAQDVPAGLLAGGVEEVRRRRVERVRVDRGLGRDRARRGPGRRRRRRRFGRAGERDGWGVAWSCLLVRSSGVFARMGNGTLRGWEWFRRSARRRSRRARRQRAVRCQLGMSPIQGSFVYSPVVGSTT